MGKPMVFCPNGLIKNRPFLNIFKEFPDFLSIAGATIIIISGYLNYKLKIKA